MQLGWLSHKVGGFVLAELLMSLAVSSLLFLSLGSVFYLLNFRINSSKQSLSTVEKISFWKLRMARDFRDSRMIKDRLGELLIFQRDGSEIRYHLNSSYLFRATAKERDSILFLKQEVCRWSVYPGLISAAEYKGWFRDSIEGKLSGFKYYSSNDLNYGLNNIPDDRTLDR